MSRTSTLATLDSALGGKVSKLLADGVRDGRSASQLRDELRDDHNITISERTVRRWLTDLEPQGTK